MYLHSFYMGLFKKWLIESKNNLIHVKVRVNTNTKFCIIHIWYANDRSYMTKTMQCNLLASMFMN